MSLPPLLLVILSLSLAPTTAGSFSTTGSMTISRSGHSAVLLPNGKVLVSGGVYQGVTSELYNSNNGTWSATGSMATSREAASTSILLTNGKVLVSGGYQSNSGAYLKNAEIYDPTNAAWFPTGLMTTARSQCNAIALPNGRALITGGQFGGGGATSSAEIYDSATGTWSETGSMNHYHVSHTATLLADGTCLVTGGISAGTYLSVCELWDPVTGTWAETTSMNSARASHTATLLPNGKVLVTGGQGPTAALSSTEIWDPVTKNWTPSGAMSKPRVQHTATLLANGKVFIASSPTTEVFDPITGEWSGAGAMSTSRSFHTATLLANGKVLIAGGGNTFAEIYNPNAAMIVDVGGVNLTDGSSSPVGFVTTMGIPMTKTFTITNTGAVAFTILGVAKDGTNPGEFNVNPPTGGSLAAGGSTTFTVTFTPTNAQARSAAIHISSSLFGAINPFDIPLNGIGLDYSTDTDGDGMSDAAELNFAALGFDWQKSQIALVATLNSGANGAGLFTSQQVQALHTGTPLISRNPATGRFKLTMDWKKSADLAHFTDFPAPVGSSVLINPSGDIDFEFSLPDNAAFFRLELK